MRRVRVVAWHRLRHQPQTISSCSVSEQHLILLPSLLSLFAGLFSPYLNSRIKAKKFSFRLFWHDISRSNQFSSKNSLLRGPSGARGARRTVTGIIGRTYTVGLRLRECRSRSRRFFFRGLHGTDGSRYGPKRPYNRIRVLDFKMRHR